MLPSRFSDSGFDDSASLGFTIFAGFVITFIVVVFVVTIVGIVRKGRYLKRHGIDPLTADAQLLTQLSRSQLLNPADAPRPTLEQRLDELESLHRRGRITDEEHAEARRSLLGGN